MRNTVTTRALAESLGVSPEAIRGALHRLGHYYGVTPKSDRQGTGRRMHWPANSAERIRRNKEKKAAAAAKRREATRKKWIAITCKRRMAERAAEGRTRRQTKHRQTVDTEQHRAALLRSFALSI